MIEAQRQGRNIEKILQGVQNSDHHNILIDCHRRSDKYHKKINFSKQITVKQVRAIYRHYQKYLTTVKSM